MILNAYDGIVLHVLWFLFRLWIIQPIFYKLLVLVINCVMHVMAAAPF